MNKKEKDTGIDKHFDSCFDLMDKFYKTKRVKITAVDGKGVSASAYLKKNKTKGFILTGDRDFKTHLFFSDKIYYRHMSISSGKNEYLIGSHHIFSRGSHGYEIKVGEIMAKGFSEKRKLYQRVVIPLRKSITFHFIFETSRAIKHRTETLHVSIEGFDLDIMVHGGHTENPFLIIDSRQKIGHGLFSDYAFSCLVSLGYMTGRFVQNEAMYFSYATKDMKEHCAFKYLGLRDSIYSIFHPTYTNPYGFNMEETKAEKLRRSMQVLSAKQFSDLCTLTHQETNFRATLIILQEGFKQSIFSFAITMAVVLESLTNIYVQNNPNDFIIVREPKVSRKILKELRTVVSANKAELGELEAKVLEKVNQINQVSNKVKLTKPFEMVGFALNEWDEKIIQRRNDLLHGRLKLDYQSDDEGADREMYLIATKLYTLINILILKRVGYSGYIVNWPVYNKHVHKVNLKEELFRRI